ncbi:tetratricopeptide repeat protein [Pararhodospirillum oryzae]|uniref:Tetratricopeptide repeat protein n=1 Tax=Pararhodospirillum oryzae TaxID=478448 RepID=A0A512HAT7_9PROT|nr:tetratricopeptide repeat protein [Pararhodospirillum oryzae]GEO82500.1 hypothetical protein ROR02_26310 [Pararhodospirillum oryzae]
MDDVYSGQTARQDGHGNVVVQIIGEHNTVSVAGARALRLVQYDQPVFAQAPATPGKAGEPGWTATGRQEIKILSPYNRDSLPFVGRDLYFKTLQKWMERPNPWSIQAVVGDEGKGKTRLAVELAAWARTQGWTAGFVDSSTLAELGATDFRMAWTAPCLVIVDNASAKTTALAAWLRTLIHDLPPPDGPAKLRLLLLERTGPESGGSWWRRLFDDADPMRALTKALAPGAPVAFFDKIQANEGYAIFAAAYTLACGHPAPPASALLDWRLDAAAEWEIWNWRTAPMHLAVFGLAAAKDGLEAAITSGPRPQTFDVARRELARIDRVWQNHGLATPAQPPLSHHLAAAIVLCGGWDEAQGHTLIARESEALGQPIAPDALATAWAALREALPGPNNTVAAVVPDILGEALALVALQDLPDLGAATLRRLARTHRPALPHIVIRAFPTDICAPQKVPLAWLKTLFDDAPDLDALIALSDALPSRNHLKASLLSIPIPDEMLSEITQAVLDRCDELPTDEAAVLELRMLDTLSRHLNEKEALEATQKTVECSRSLAARNPDAFTPSLAKALDTLSARLARAGRREEALEAGTEAVKICRSLATQDPDAFNPSLAKALDTLSVYLANAGRHEEALEAWTEAVGIYRSLATQNPDTFSRSLALTLYGTCGYLRKIGRDQEALTACSEAITIYRPLALQNPITFSHTLFYALRDLADWLEKNGDLGQALEANREAIESMTPAPAFHIREFLSADLRRMAIRKYQEQCTRAGIAVDEGLLEPILNAIDAFSTHESETASAALRRRARREKALERLVAQATAAALDELSTRTSESAKTLTGGVWEWIKSKAPPACKCTVSGIEKDPNGPDAKKDMGTVFTWIFFINSGARKELQDFIDARASVDQTATGNDTTTIR